MAVTIKDIAAKLGINHSTVGYALSGKGTIKQSTRDLVLKTANEMGYVRNRHAGNMRATSSNTIGVIMPNVLMGYGELVQHLFSKAQSRGYELRIAVTEFDGHQEAKALSAMLEQRCEAILMKTCHPTFDDLPDDHIMRTKAAKSVPIFTFGTAMENAPFGALLIDNFSVGKILGKHLAELGHHRVAVGYDSEPPLYKAHIEFYDGIIEGLKSGGCSNPSACKLTLDAQDPSDQPPHERSYQRFIDDMTRDAHGGRGATLLSKALNHTSKPSALVMQSDLAAVGAVQEAVRQNIKLPEKLSIAAGNQSMAASFSPIPLTRVYPGHDELAKSAIDLMFRAIDAKASSKYRNATMRCTPTLFQGHTTGPV